MISKLNYVLIADGLCPDLDGWYFAPGANTDKRYKKGNQKNAADIAIDGENNVYLLEQTFNKLTNQGTYDDVKNIDNFKDECGELYEFLKDAGFSDNIISLQLLLPCSIFVKEMDGFTKEDLKLVLNQTDVGRKVLTDESYVTQLYNYVRGGVSVSDSTSIDFTNGDDDQDTVCLTTNIDYLVSCIEMNLAQEYKVINFDFYNDWVNGTIYIPR